MRIVQLNMTPYGSTGRIMLQSAQVSREAGHSVTTYSTELFSTSGKPKPFFMEGHKTWGSFYENAVHYVLGSTLGRNGFYTAAGTRKLLRELNEIKPDVIHLHNLHGYCIHLPLLFGYIKKNNIPVVWTLHDCWSFTGHCPYFDMAGCDKWKEQCHNCAQFGGYPKSRIDDSKRMYRNKRKWFTGVQNMTLVTPSQWLADLVKQSFLKEYPVVVIHNGIDQTAFQPTPGDFKKRFGCENKKVLLGVAFDWGKRKGLDVFLELASRLDDRYQIVLVGTNDLIDAQLPPNIISIHKTHDQKELAQIYSAADLFVNPTREDNFPTVNIEALACGTPVLTFRTGGSPEIIDDTCGAAVEKDDVDGMLEQILKITADNPFTEENCTKRAKQFDAHRKFQEYVVLYEDVLKQRESEV